jgi:hypothetical protein
MSIFDKVMILFTAISIFAKLLSAIFSAANLITEATAQFAADYLIALFKRCRCLSDWILFHCGS